VVWGFLFFLFFFFPPLPLEQEALKHAYCWCTIFSLSCSAVNELYSSWTRESTFNQHKTQVHCCFLWWEGKREFFVQNPYLNTSLGAGIIRSTLMKFFSSVFGICAFLLCWMYFQNYFLNFSSPSSSQYLTGCLNCFVASLYEVILKYNIIHSSHIFWMCVSLIVNLFACLYFMSREGFLQAALEAWEKYSVEAGHYCRRAQDQFCLQA